MNWNKVTKKQWQSYFDRYSFAYLKDKRPQYIKLLVMSQKVGVQQTGWTVVERAVADWHDSGTEKR
ncbi:MAG: hypothetical protein U5J63_01730 [Fodinibius sp.]|nr:hypothetical protein [Fodinibius sp.]